MEPTLTDTPLTKKQRRQLRRQQKEAERQKRHQRSQTKKLLRWIILVFALFFAGWGIYKLGAGPKIDSSLDHTKVYETDWLKGDAKASVVLFEYGDFQCPACASYFPLVQKLTSDYSKEILVVYRHYPLRRIHRNAQIASQAAEAAGRQGKFWEMHDMLFENQSSWSSHPRAKNAFTEFAERLGLDKALFEGDLESREVKEKVSRDFALATQAGVNSTPTFVLNGAVIQNPTSYELFQAIIEAAISNRPRLKDDSDGHDENDIHVHADFAVYLDGVPVDFTESKYQSTESGHLHPTLHLHDGKGNILHRHADGVTLSDFFKSLGMKFTKQCFTQDNGVSHCSGNGKEFRMYVNGKLLSVMEEYVVQDLDQILITFGLPDDETIQSQIDSVTDEACIYSARCPERGSPPEEACVKGLGGRCQ